MKGTTPEGTHDEMEASRWVRAMFGRVAPRYDLANHLLSFNMDKHWRARTVERVRPVLHRPEARVLDLCCGTGDLTIALEAARGAPVIGSDFCHPMLTAAGRKSSSLRLVEADALRLPFADASLDLITIAFGFRNLANYDAGLVEFRRVLRSGGMLAILEFSQPRKCALCGAVCVLFTARAAAHRRRDIGRAGGLRIPARIGAQVPPRGGTRRDDARRRLYRRKL